MADRDRRGSGDPRRDADRLNLRSAGPGRGAKPRRGGQGPGNPAEVGLDELFEPDWADTALTTRDEPLPLSPFRDRRWWLRKIFFSLGLGAVIFGGLRLARLEVPYALLVLTILAVLLLRHALREVAAEPLPDAVTGRNVDRSAMDPADPARGGSGLRHSVMPSDGLAFAVGRWDDRLAWSERDPDRFHVLMMPRLRELVDERLRRRHGVTIDGDPQRARELLGEELWSLLHASRRVTGKNRPGARTLESIVARLEGL